MSIPCKNMAHSRLTSAHGGIWTKNFSVNIHDHWTTIYVNLVFDEWFSILLIFINEWNVEASDTELHVLVGLVYTSTDDTTYIL